MKKIMLGINRQLLAGALLSVAFTATQANALTMYDLSTAGSSATINGALFTQGEVQPAGTGVIDSFVRIQANGTERGINSDGPAPYAMDEKMPADGFTRDIQLNEVSTRDIGGTLYREFFLDINENNSEAGHLLSLDQVQIFLAASAIPDGTYNTSGTGSLPGATMIYQMNGPTDFGWVKLDYNLQAGSGESDMFLYVLDSLFSLNGASNPYVYLFSQFGAQGGIYSADGGLLASDAGFEEWAVRRGGAPVPEPATMLLFGTGLIGLAGMARRKRNY